MWGGLNRSVISMNYISNRNVKVHQRLQFSGNVKFENISLIAHEGFNEILQILIS